MYLDIRTAKTLSGKSGTRKLWRRIAKNKTVYLLILPVVAIFVIFYYIPMAGVVMAFNSYKVGLGFAGIFTSPWVGLEHFRRLFASSYLLNVMFNTLWLSILKLVFCFPAPILFALILNEVRDGLFKRSIQTVTYLPNFLSAIVIYGLVQGMLSPTYGFINGVRALFGLPSEFYLASSHYFRSILVAIDLWRGFGWGAIVYLAAITGIDSEIYEAATIDGANRFQKMRHVTLPGMSSIISLFLILNIGNIMNAGFEMVFLLQSPTVMSVADIIDLYTYRLGIQEASYSFGAAVGLFKSVISLILVVFSNWAAKKSGNTGIW